MITSLFLAKILGIYLVLVCSALLMNKKYYIDKTDEFFANPLMVMFLGSIALILGLLVVFSHNIWVANWTILITAIGWVMIAKGIFRICFPKYDKELSTYLVQNCPLCLQGILGLSFFIGLFLTYKGFGF